MKTLIKVLICIFLGVLGSCKKYLNEKPNSSFFVPSTFEDLQAMLDDSSILNTGNIGTSLIEVVADDYYVTSSNWRGFGLNERQSYVWARDFYDYENWRLPYSNIIYTTNVVLDQIPKVNTGTNSDIARSVEGTALFFRSSAFYLLAQLYCKPYSATSNTDMGIVLRQTSAVEAKSVRSTLFETYTKILTDLTRASELLPEQSGYATRPNKAAAFAMLARVYLSMREYEKALEFSNLALNLNGTLLDYNDLLLTNNPILPIFTNNPEIYFFVSLRNSGATGRTVAKIDSNLYRSYGSNDLRKRIFFEQNTGANAGTYRFNGSYYRLASVFNGLSTGEQYLIKAECLARAGKTLDALNILNTLLRKRYNKNSFTDQSAVNANEAKELILRERRKELIYRGLRWSDLRRLNLEGANITLKRVLDGVTYTLPPNDSRWVVLIPNEEIIRSQIPQNPN